MFNNTDDFRQHFERQYSAKTVELSFCAENQYLKF